MPNAPLKSIDSTLSHSIISCIFSVSNSFQLLTEVIWCFFGCTIPSNGNLLDVFPQNSAQPVWYFWKLSDLQLNLKEFCGFKQRLAAQYEFAMTGPSVACCMLIGFKSSCPSVPLCSLSCSFSLSVCVHPSADYKEKCLTSQPLTYCSKS